MLILSKRTFGNDNGVCRRVEELWRIDKFQPRTLKPPGRLRRVAEKPHFALVRRPLCNARRQTVPRAVRKELSDRLDLPSLAAINRRRAAGRAQTIAYFVLDRIYMIYRIVELEL